MDIQTFRAIVESTQPLGDSRDRVIVVVTDDVSVKVEVSFEGSSIDELKSACRKAITDAQGAVDLKSLVVGQVLDLSMPGQPEPTDADKARTAYGAWTVTLTKDETLAFRAMDYAYSLERDNSGSEDLYTKGTMTVAYDVKNAK